MTIAVAVLVAVAGLMSSAAAGEWQSSVRQEVKRSAALLQYTSRVYGSEAPIAFDLAVLEARAARLSGADAKVERKALFSLRRAYISVDTVVSGDRYRRADGSYNLARRLADLRTREPLPDPQVAVRAGDRKRDQASVVILAVIPLLLLYLVAEFVLRRRQKGRRGASITAAADDVDLVPRPWSSPSKRRFGVSVALVAWLAVALFAVCQVQFANAEARAQSASSRKAVQVSTALGAGTLRSNFALDAARRARMRAVEAVGKQLVALDESDQATVKRLGSEADVEKATSDIALSLAHGLSRPLTAVDGVDAATRDAVNATLADADVLRKDQNREADRANAAGTRTSRVALAILFAGLALSLSALAGSTRVAGATIMDRSAAGLLALALLAAFSALVF
ncbi:MAG: hypothetical protein QOG56_705 [Solirubrobacteraceae bacterium]|nr:hypothetical protein [Solirubrobacteraceae bacterium]